MCGDRSRDESKRAAQTSRGCHLQGANDGWGARNPESDSGRRPPGLERPEIGRGNCNLRWDVIVEYAHRTNHDRRILAGDLRLGQIIANRAVRVVANPIILSNNLETTGGELQITSAACRMSSDPMTRLMVNAKNRVQARAGTRYCRHSSREEPSHNGIGWAISQE